MINLTTNWLRSLGLLPTPLTPEQVLRYRCAKLSMRVMAAQMNELHVGTGYPEPFRVIGKELR